jgi:chromosome partitioning protein
MGKIIAVANHKGGVGKTTSVACIGASLVGKGYRVLLVDLDAQQNLTTSLLQEEVEISIYEALIGKAALPIISLKENLSLVPAGLGLARAEIDLSTRIAREQILKNLLEPVAGEYDFILIDCPPSLGIVTTNALTAGEEVIIPLTAEVLPLKGLNMLDEVIDEIRRTINKSLKLGAVFFTRYNNRKLNNIVEDAIKAKYGEIVCTSRIRENISIAEAPATCTDIYDYAPTSNGAKDYQALTEELLQRWI